METIFALASGSTRAGVAVVRISGPAALSALKTLAGTIPPLRSAHLCDLKDGDTLLDRALVLAFKAPASFTGEDVAEFHLHGGRAVIDGVLHALGKIPQCRMALPGEFTKRAFENGKMDLTEAEAIADLINAETEAQKSQALAQLGGALSAIYNEWTETLKNILAHQEADIEFPDEDLPSGLSDTLKPAIEKLLQDISAHLDDNRRGERLRDGLRIAILGAPNAGKSSLLNALLQRDAAIVSAEAGTTRDVIEAHLNLGGYPVILVDTAGLRDTDNTIETEGIRRAKEQGKTADLKLALFDSTLPVDAETENLIDDKTIILQTKADLAPSPVKRERAGVRAVPTLSISTQTKTGLDTLLKTLTERAATLLASANTPPLTRTRHRTALEEARTSLTRCLTAPYPELAAEDLRMSLRHLGKITGSVHVEDVLDAVFRDFCIGK